MLLLLSDYDSFITYLYFQFYFIIMSIMPKPRIILFSVLFGMFALITLLLLMDIQPDVTGNTVLSVRSNQNSFLFIIVLVSVLLGLLTFGIIHMHYNVADEEK